ncbi:Outer membrane protein OmpA [Acinetobacter boissieri]|uniref:Outer membrane protein OmpA n=2 Tax=Acinetobacter boissieri TaxID=1219383 RepID=A0A1G6GFM6_9GAMM|nr:OmpA family protein [Acinetobacter boissieri]SDB80822.1 Outer membrane protein OmpA [Acinetobacter boissieri]
MNKIVCVALLILMTHLLTACQLGGLNYKQSIMLERKGFHLTDEGWALGLPERILFGFDQSKITPQQQSNLIKLAEELKKYQLYKVKVIGHTDNIGNNEYNIKLSEVRAKSVAKIFYLHGFNIQDITIIGRGASEPMNSNDNEEHKANNRRVTIIVIP